MKYRGFKSHSTHKLCGGMVYTLDLKSNPISGYRFKSDVGHLIKHFALLAQLVEHYPDTVKVGSSILSVTTDWLVAQR